MHVQIFQCPPENMTTLSDNGRKLITKLEMEYCLDRAFSYFLNQVELTLNTENKTAETDFYLVSYTEKILLMANHKLEPNKRFVENCA